MFEISREELQRLASQPLGAAHLQEEAEAKAHTMAPRSQELIETCKRVGKRWLPLGRETSRRPRCNIPAEQIDIEDAVEAAGGKRGSFGK